MVGAVGLPEDGAVPVQADSRQIGHLAVGGPDSHPVEVLQPEMEQSVRAPGEQPGQQGRPEVARRAGRRTGSARNGRHPSSAHPAGFHVTVHRPNSRAVPPDGAVGPDA